MAARSNRSKLIVYSLMLATIVAAFTIVEDSHADWESDKDELVRDTAKGVAARIAGELPMQISGNMTMRSAWAINNEVQLVVALAYDQAFLKAELAKQGQTPESVKPMMEAIARNSVCSTEVMRAFIRLGGGVRYGYQFNDGSIYMTVVVDECPGAS